MQSPSTRSSDLRRCPWALASAFAAAAAQAAFTPLTPLPAPRITASATAYPGGAFEVGNLRDGTVKTEYSSDSKGTGTFVEFEFEAPVRVGAFRHLDRNDPATITGSELVFADAGGSVVATVPVQHSGARGGETFCALPSPVTAQRVTWRVTKLGPQGYGTVGGAEIAFYSAGTPEAAPGQDTIEVRVLPIVDRAGDGLRQALRVTLNHLYAEAVEAVLRLDDAEPKSLGLLPGRQTLDLPVPAVTAETTTTLALEVAGQTVARAALRRTPVRPLTVYVLPHSHTDIGYTEIQTEIEDKQVQNLIRGMAIARRTADYPPGARFVWNVEELWAADLYLRRLGQAQREEFIASRPGGTGRAQRDVPERTDRPLPPRGAGPALPPGDATRRGRRACRWTQP